MHDFKHDKFWHGAAIGCPSVLTPWLRDRGSLTQRIQQRCTDFEVLGMRSFLARIAFDEAVLLGVIPHQLAYTREVFLVANNLPVVFAHSACARIHLRGAWSALCGLGSKPLGTLLFSHPLVERRPLHYKALNSTHPLHRLASTKLAHPPEKLWARRSLFYLHDAPLLVTEVFLPGILQLAKQD